MFSKVPPDQIQRIYVDPDSRTSIVLAKLIWPALYGNDVAFVDLDSAANFDHHESILLIGDKVVAMQLDEFRYQVDLGSAWKTWTGLPFVFAVWAADAGPNTVALGRFLSTVRDAGIRQVGQLAVEFGPAHGWTPALAQQYLQHNLRFGLSDKHVEGMVRFLDLANERGFAAQRKELQAI